MNAFVALTIFIVLENLEPLRGAKLVLVNKEIHVERGRAAYITENELQFNISNERDSCKVEVVLNEPVTQRVGKLTPQVFDCHFLPNEVKYIHNGCPLLNEDRVMLRVYRFTELETAVEMFTLHIVIRSSKPSLVQFGQVSLEVPEFFGISQPIDRNILTFKYNGLGKACTVRILSSELLFPAVGQVVVEDSKIQKSEDVSTYTKQKKAGQSKPPCPSNGACHSGLKEIHLLKMSCEDFLEMRLRYQHLSPPSPDKDYISIQVEIRDKKSRFQLQAENVWIPVRIKGAIPNRQPQAAFMSMFILEIDEFILTPLTTVTLDAEDEETPRERLLFNITKPPPQGYVTHLDDHSKAITSFTWQDLYDTKVAFQPSNISHSERQNYEVEFQAIDSLFMNSFPIMVHFSIRSAVTNAPRVAWNTGLDLLEGQSRPITWESLQIVDNDNLNAVQLLVVEGLYHGWLTIRGNKGFRFAVKDLRDGVVRYHHDDSDTTKDDIVFRIFDEKHSARHRFPINILPKDDTPPFLVNNLVIELEEGSTVLIENHMLMATDFDSSDDYILYKISKPPSAGELIKQHFPDGPGIPVFSFYQRDLFHGLIYYRHFGGEIFQDSFEFNLADSQEPPNLSDPQIVMMLIMPVKDHLPEEVPGTIRHLVVKETEIVHITKDHLHFTDAESPDSQLMYTVTKPCFSPASPGVYDAGKLIFTDSMKNVVKNSSIPFLSSFTQHAITHMKVAYMPPLMEMGPDPLFVQFEFSVSDQQEGVMTGLLFNITVMPVDDEAPEIFTNHLKIEEGTSAFITGEHLMVTDVDTKNSDIQIELKKLPLHGHVELHGLVMSEGDKFTLWDLHSSKVRYQHDSSETLEDRIIFSATDGFNTADGTLRVKIIPVNDEPPELQSGLRSSLECLEGERVFITAEYLYATDADSEDSRLIYMIARAPKHGVIQKDGFVVEKFSQHDITQGSISYVHTGGEIGHSYLTDSVTLIISDGEAGTVDGCCADANFPPPVPLHPSFPVYDLNISVVPINNQRPTIQTGEMFVVEEGSSACISLKYLDASDEDTTPEELTFFLETSPQYGYLENILPTPGHEKSNAGVNISVFTFQSLQAGYINYVQSKHEHLEPSSDHFMVSVSDGFHKSLAMPFYIIIDPVNDEIPSLQVRNLTVMEGDIKEMGPGTINVEDFDVPQDVLRFYIATPPRHGVILNGIYGRDTGRYKQLSPALLHKDLEIHSFTLEELKQGLMLMYMHDDTESLEDSFTIQLTDGKHTVQGTLYIFILPVNDEIPHLSRNTGLEVEVHENKVISSVSLEVEDKDSLRNQLHYVINNKPRYGHLKLKTTSAWSTLHPGMNFTQDDVDMNRLWYFHTSVLSPESHDSFRFFVTDGKNRSPPESFYIFIKSVAKGDIVLSTKPVTLTEGDRVTLTTDVLMATDGTGKPGKLLYAISVPPVHGQIEYINYPGVPISRYSQLDVVAQKVCYVHDNSHEASKDSFSFTISNGHMEKKGLLELNIEHNDQIPPTLLTNKGLHIVEGSIGFLTSDILKLTDVDSPVKNLTYIITQYPQYGHLYMGETVIYPGQFTQLDVDNAKVYYKHNRGGGHIDKFSFIATDKVNHGFLVNGQLTDASIEFTIQVECQDKMVPKLIVKASPTTIQNLKDGRFAVPITVHNLKVTDANSRDEELVFSVRRHPFFGHLENSGTGRLLQNSFTQHDLNQHNIRYILNPTTEVTSDTFEFEASDRAGNTIAPEILEIKWSRIELAETCYRVCENIGSLPIKLQRTGESAEPSFVGIKVQEVSARVGLDFKHSTARLVQFDPGVSIKIWNILLQDDGLEENTEVFKITLNKPKNAILGHKRELTVEILDPKAGDCDSSTTFQDGGTQKMLERTSSNSGSLLSAGRSHKASERADVLREEHLNNRNLPHNHHGSLARGYIPQTGHLPDHVKMDFQVLADSKHQAVQHNPPMYQGITPTGAGGQFILPSAVRAAAREPVPVLPFHLQHQSDLPQRDLGMKNEPVPLQPSTKQRTKSRKCPSSWTLRDKHCYILSSIRNASWDSAEKACRKWSQGHLASVHSPREMAWLWKFANKQPFWIGLNEGKTGSWMWSNGRPVTFHNVKSRPELSKTAEQKCAFVKKQKKWVARLCRQRLKGRYICSLPSLTDTSLENTKTV
ncbi:FRAS1-related extracellular matrix protein 1-like isoform X1 [Podarcis lilfordi]|uniref:FRAS1-related extracellular matrix protein 1-like isoform X1 n=1 Tax=Podarcis lilfordi TaxID=74358 RepID=A0AA35KGT6_9SAUR|nr:FRAS1-related extracellular matrix protein 1-like isoform X1 [Podarcis lilfordi]